MRNVLYCIDLPRWDESVIGLTHSMTKCGCDIGCLEVTESINRYKQWNKSRIWQALAMSMTQCFVQNEKAVRLLTCRKSPICSISSLKCSIFLLMVKLGSVEVYS